VGRFLVKPPKGGEAMTLYQGLHLAILLGSLIVAIVAVTKKTKK